MPRSRQTAATSPESVATTTGSISPLAAAARHTHSTIGRPAISRSTLRVSRVELSRAGITPAILYLLMQPSLHERLQQNQGRCIPEPRHSSRRDQQGAATSNEANQDIAFLVLL